MEASAAKKWSVAFSCCLLNFLQTSGFFFTPTTIMPLLVADLGLDLSLSTVPIAAGKLAYVLMLLPGGMAVDAFGPRRGVLGGIAALGALLAAYALLVRSFASAVAAHVAMAAASSVCGVPVYSLFVAQWFRDGIGLAMGLTLAGFSLGGTLMPAVLGPVAAEFGWRAAVGTMAALLWLVALPVAYFFLDEAPGAAGDAGDSAAPSSPAADVEEAASLLPQRTLRPTTRRARVDNKSWTFVGFALSYMLLQYSFGTFAENLLFHLTLDRGWSLSLASLFFSAMNLASFSAKLIGGHVGDSYDRFYVGSIMSGVTSVGVLCLFIGGGVVDAIPRITHSPIMVAIFSIVFGFGYGATFNALYCLVPLVFGNASLGRIQSSLFGLGLVGNAAGSILTGILRSRYGSYDRGFLIAGAACFANLCVFNITRTTLGGTMKGLARLKTEEVSAVDPNILEDLRSQKAHDDAVAARIGVASDQESVSTSSPPGSFLRVPSNDSGFFGAAFRLSPSTEQLFLQSISPGGSHDGRRGGHYGSLGNMNIGPPALGDYDEDISTDWARGPRVPGLSSGSGGHGVRFESGFVDPRIHTSSSLSRLAHGRRRGRRSRTRQSLGNDLDMLPESSSPLSRALMRSSSTLENLIASGVMSHSLEDIGYAGRVGQAPPGSPTMRSPSPRARSPSPATSPRARAVCTTPASAGSSTSAAPPVAHVSARPPPIVGASSAQGLVKPPLHRSSSARRVHASSGPTPTPTASMSSPPAGSPPTTIGACSPQSFGVLPSPLRSGGRAAAPAPAPAPSEAQLRQAVEDALDRSVLTEMTLRKTTAAVAEALGTTPAALRPRKVTIREIVAEYLAARGISGE